MLAIISAMESEIKAICDKLDNVKHDVISGCSIDTGTLFGLPVVCAVCGEGKVNAAMCTQGVILRFSPDAVINLGVGGGVYPGLKTGDIVVADRVVQHDYDVSALGYEPGRVCNFEQVYMPCDPILADALFSCANNVLDDTFCVYRGTVATGDSFISDSVRAKGIFERFGAYIVDMEGASIGQVCLLNQIPFGVVRAVSDNGDDGAFKSFRDFLDYAVGNSVRMIESYVQHAVRANG